MGRRTSDLRTRARSCQRHLPRRTHKPLHRVAEEPEPAFASNHGQDHRNLRAFVAFCASELHVRSCYRVRRIQGFERQDRRSELVCDPSARWQNGSVENANKRIRRFMPGSTDLVDAPRAHSIDWFAISTISQESATDMERQQNCSRSTCWGNADAIPSKPALIHLS